MKRKKGLIALALAAIGSLVIFAGCRGHHAHGHFALDYVSEVLDLSEEQEAKLESIREELRAEYDGMHEEKEQMHLTIKEQLTGVSIDKAVLLQVVSEHRSRMDPLIDLAIDRLAEFHAELTPEQKQKLVAKLEKLEQHHSARFTKE